MMIVHPGNAAATGYNLQRSLRFRASASAYLSRSPVSATNRKTWTYSFLVKRGLLSSSATYSLFDAGPDANNWFSLWFRNDTIGYDVSYVTTANRLMLSSTAVYRDPSNYYHVVLSVDTTQATAANRIRIYINGSEVALNKYVVGSGYVAQNADLAINTTTGHRIGVRDQGSVKDLYFDGYLSEVNFIDGQALTPSSFGSYNSTTGVWQPAKYQGAYGTNGFYLPFTDNSSLTTSSNVGLGKDFSGNGNYWTTNNISITSGVTYDSMTDVPTLTSATAANFAVWNPLDVASSMTASNGNLKLYGTAAVSLGRASIPIPTTGKFYYEMTMDLGADANNAVAYGICLGNRSKNAGINQTGDYMLYISNNGYLIQNGVSAGNIGFVPGVNSIIQVAVDVDSGKMWFGVNNSWYIAGGAATGNPSTGANPTLTGSLGGLFPFLYLDNTVTIGTSANFGQRPFAYTPPSGYVALNTFNLPDGTVTTSGSFVGNVSADGPSVNLNGVPTAMTINGNAVTFGTHADKTAYGFKVRSSSTSYNSTGTNTYSITTTGAKFKYANAQGNP